jgi:hypothetical protein
MQSTKSSNTVCQGSRHGHLVHPQMPLYNQLNHQILYVKAHVMDTLCTQPEMHTVSEIGHCLAVRPVFALCECDKAETKFIL